MFGFKIEDWSNAYSNSANIAGGDRWPGAWEEPARRYLEEAAAARRVRLDLSYGAATRNRLDLFLPEGDPKGLVVFIHGGYWMQCDQRFLSHLAKGPLARGYAVAMPTYTHCPEVTISDITAEVGAAIMSAAAMVGGPIMITGHSAGGHLASRMACENSPLSAEIRKRVRHILSISGLHDLRPLMRTAMNETLRLDEATACAESPALLRPIEGARVTCWVGNCERPEFRRQNALLANIWMGLGAETAAIEEPDRHHYNVVDGLADPDHPLTRTLLGE
ncbi:alpha/beta hydrolase [Rhizobium sp. ARZ01]|uniref:alpha/beta hydrolase n=1 Tax=Rhizobium sp. ARZ01 TaxID=2769313 RepID=UPI00178012FF|nr:alpha/beta hydrolase [Rhizobium sp. ARZ01]MBD9371365.1 alpha/beta hydrolase [Rhizobium sp. ARZ01]